MHSVINNLVPQRIIKPRFYFLIPENTLDTDSIPVLSSSIKWIEYFLSKNSKIPNYFIRYTGKCLNLSV